VVLRVRGFVRELLGSLNFSLDQRRGRERRGGLNGEGEDGGVPRIVLGQGEEGSGRGRCGEGGARGGLFIGARGKGSGGARRAPVRCTAPPMRLHGGAVPGKDVGQAGRTGRCRTLPVRRGDSDGGDGGEGTTERRMRGRRRG
jgi:hypothetical protein